jgi:hypothetical protein
VGGQQLFSEGSAKNLLQCPWLADPFLDDVEVKSAERQLSSGMWTYSHMGLNWQGGLASHTMAYVCEWVENKHQMAVPANKYWIKTWNQNCTLYKIVTSNSIYCRSEHVLSHDIFICAATVTSITTAYWKTMKLFIKINIKRVLCVQDKKKLLKIKDFENMP